MCNLVHDILWKNMAYKGNTNYEEPEKNDETSEKKIDDKFGDEDLHNIDTLIHKNIYDITYPKIIYIDLLVKKENDFYNNSTKFRRILNSTNKNFYNLNFDNILIAGGFVSYFTFSNNSINTNNICDMHDIDIFIYGLNELDAHNKVTYLINHLTKDYDYFSSTFLNSHQYYITRTNHCVNIIMNVQLSYNEIKYKKDDFKFQIILYLHKSKSSILHRFDLGSSCVGYDGQNILLTSFGKFSFEYGCNIVDTTSYHRTYNCRLKKYLKRGFNIIVPLLNINKLTFFTFFEDFSDKQITNKHNFNYIKPNKLKNFSVLPFYQLKDFNDIETLYYSETNYEDHFDNDFETYEIKDGYNTKYNINKTEYLGFYSNYNVENNIYFKLYHTDVIPPNEEYSANIDSLIEWSNLQDDYDISFCNNSEKFNKNEYDSRFGNNNFSKILKSITRNTYKNIFLKDVNQWNNIIINDDYIEDTSNKFIKFRKDVLKSNLNLYYVLLDNILKYKKKERYEILCTIYKYFFYLKNNQLIKNNYNKHIFDFISFIDNDYNSWRNFMKKTDHDDKIVLDFKYASKTYPEELIYKMIEFISDLEINTSIKIIRCGINNIIYTHLRKLDLELIKSKFCFVKKDNKKFKINNSINTFKIKPEDWYDNSIMSNDKISFKLKVYNEIYNGDHSKLTKDTVDNIYKILNQKSLKSSSLLNMIENYEICDIIDIFNNCTL